MSLSIFYTIDTWLLCLIQFCIMLACMKLGQYFAIKTSNKFSSNNPDVAITTSIYALSGLLLAFTFSFSADRFRERRQVIVEEANAISTAVLRTQLYDDSVQARFYENFKSYLDSRIEYYAAAADTNKIRSTLLSAERYQEKLWEIAGDNSRISENFVASSQMVQALNQMFDVANTRYWSEYNRTPSSILIMLFSLSFATSFIGGYNSVGKGAFDWFLAIGFCLFTSLVIFFILDLDKPRTGVITLDDQRAIVDLKKMFK